MEPGNKNEPKPNGTIIRKGTPEHDKIIKDLAEQRLRIGSDPKQWILPPLKDNEEIPDF